VFPSHPLEQPSSTAVKILLSELVQQLSEQNPVEEPLPDSLTTFYSDKDDNYMDNTRSIDTVVYWAQACVKSRDTKLPLAYKNP
jgi:hypothetical protein